MNKALIFLLTILILSGLFITTVVVDQPVYFADENFENAVRSILNHSGKPIYRSQLLKIVNLNLSYQGIEDLTGIENFRNLEVLNLYKNNINDVSRLKTLTNLRDLNLGGNRLVDLQAAHFDELNHIELYSLNLDQNESFDEGGWHQLSDISLLENFPSLETLSLQDNAIKDFSPLITLQKLTSLDLAKNHVQDISFLHLSPNLRHLNFRDNNIQDISVLSELSDLEYLNLHSNERIETIRPIAGLLKLEELILRNVPIGDEIDAIAGLPNLTYLNVRNCSISDYGVIARMMSEGILQDDPEELIYTSVNIRDNILSDNGQDPLAALRPYWHNISHREPYQLPSFGSRVEMPEFSHPGGFYTDEFNLTLSVQNPDLEIYYTLDGSDPQVGRVDNPPSSYQQTFRYASAIQIASRAGDENVFSMIQTAYAGRYWLPAWYPPKGEVFKATTLRAVAYDPVRDLQSDILTQTYFVDENIDERYATLPVISLVGDYDVLFHPDNGIYITDFYGEEFLYNQSRVPVNIEYFDEDGILGFQGRYEISLQGSTSPASPQKGLHVFGGLWSSGSPYIEYPLFKNSSSKANQLTRFSRFILRSWGSARDWPIFFSDAYNQTLMAESDQDIQDYQPVIVFINGEYWGLQEIREANKNPNYYSAHYYDSAERSFDMLDMGGNVVDEGDSDHWDALLDFLYENDISEDENYAYVKTQVDIDNYIVYVIHCIYTGKLDWPEQNEYFWRPKTEEGRWRWAQFDMDHGLNIWSGPETDLMSDILAIDGMLLNFLLENDSFKQLFLNYYADLMNTYFLTEVELAHFYAMVEELDPYMPEFQDRWQLNQNWEEDKAFALNLIQQRWALRRQQVIDNFELRGSAIIKLRTDPTMGKIAINSIVIERGTPGVQDPSVWQGMYFIDIPVTIQAIPKPGYQFVRWETSAAIDPHSQEVVVILDEDLTMRAIFEPEN
jgi:hypothetical protein